jgi:hypothetical protein
LTYETRRVGPLERQTIKAQRIRRKLGGSANLLEDFPAKPRGMRPKRYEQLKARHDSAYDRSIGILAKAGFALRDEIWRRAGQ